MEEGAEGTITLPIKFTNSEWQAIEHAAALTRSNPQQLVRLYAVAMASKLKDVRKDEADAPGPGGAGDDAPQGSSPPAA